MITKHLIPSIIITSVALAGCSTRPEQQVVAEPEPADMFDNTIWTGYISNGVDIISFKDGTYTDLFYDGITGDETKEVKTYRLDQNKLTLTGSDSTIVNVYFEQTAGGNTLSIYRTLNDLNNNKPNAVLKKL